MKGCLSEKKGAAIEEDSLHFRALRLKAAVCSNQVQYSLLDRRAENVMLACPGPPGAVKRP